MANRKSGKSGRVAGLINACPPGLASGYYLIKSSGGAAQHQASRMGIYTPNGDNVEGHPVYVHENDGGYLYLNPSGRWMVGSSMTSTAGALYHQDRWLNGPPLVGWRYSNNGWHDDTTLTVTYIGGRTPQPGTSVSGGSGSCMTTPSRPDINGNPSKGNNKCIFPFTFRGKTYYDCAPGSAASNMPDDSLWCSTKVDSYAKHVSGQGEWGYCARSCSGITKVTLVGGSSPNEGNVFYNGKPVCDDKWPDSEGGYGNNNGAVVCRELGYSGLVRFYDTPYFGNVPDVFSMDDVKCTGTESRLEDCPHVTTDNCGAEEAVGVVCTV